MKKSITKAILFTVFGAFVWMIAAGNKVPEAHAACSHKYEWQTTTEPTCTKEGYEKLICMEKHPEAGTSIIRNGDTGAIGQIEKEMGNIRNQKDFRDFVEYNYENAPMTVNGCTVTKVNYDTWHIVD